MSTKKASSKSTEHSKGTIATIRETNKYGNYTGGSFYRCLTCRREVMTSWGRDAISHDEDCPNSEADR